MVFVGSNWQATGSYGMGAAAADFDNDGWPDIYVACDTAPSLLYRNNHDGTFREVAVPAGVALDEHGVALSGMGVGVGDFDADGQLDIVRTNFSEQVTTLYRNFGGTFEDTSIRAGLGINRKFVGFGVDFLDFDNDGWQDIFIANGHVYSQIADRKLHISYRQPRLLYRNLGNGRFEDVSAKAGAAITGREPRPGLCLRRLRQRRRRGHPRQQPGRASDAAAQRRRQRKQLALDQVRWHAVEPIGDRHPREGDRIGDVPSDRRSDERVRAITPRTISASISALDRRRAPTPSRSPGRRA